MAKVAFRFVACPFCQSDDQCRIADNAESSAPTFWVTCDAKGCECDGPWRKTEEAAVEAWNARGVSA
jgi:hypothetical protein